MIGFSQTTGGDNATVVEVTSLADSGPGTLREAIENVAGPRHIKIKVSGYLDLQSRLLLGGFAGNNGSSHGQNVTISGSDAHRFIVRHYGLTIERNCSDVILRDLCFMTGDQLLAEGPITNKAFVPDPLQIIGAINNDNEVAKRIRAENCTFAWGGDINATIGGSFIDFYRCLFYECLAHPNNPKGRHSKNLLILSQNVPSGGQFVSINQCVFAGVTGRNPQVSGGQVFIANNVICSSTRSTPHIPDYETLPKGLIIGDYGSYDTETGQVWPNPQYQPNKVSIVDNWFYHEDYSNFETMAVYLAIGTDPQTRVYLGTNYQNDEPMALDTISTRMRFTLPKVPMPVSAVGPPPIWVDGYQEKGFLDVIENAGAYPSRRNSQDQRVLDACRNRELLPLIESQDNVGGWPEIQETAGV